MYVGRPVDFDSFRIGHTGIARDAAPEHEAEAELVARDPKHVDPRFHQFYEDAPIFVEAGRVPPRPENAGEKDKEHRPCHGMGRHPFGGFSFSALLQRIGFTGPTTGRRGAWDHSAVHSNHHHGHHGHHGHDDDHHHGDHHHHKDKHHKGKHGKHHDHDKAPKTPEEPKQPEDGESEFAHILPIFGEDAKYKQVETDLQGQADEPETPEVPHHGDDDDHHHGKHHHGHHHKHKDGRKHKHHHGHKHHKGNKVFGSLAEKQHKLCDALKNLSPALRGFVIGAVVGAILHVFFSLALLFVRLRRQGCGASREARRERRRERKEARKAAKAAYKAAKSRHGKATEAGFEIESEEEALPSYAEGEHDPLVVRQ